MNSAKHKIGIVFGGRKCLRQSSLLSARYIYEILLEMPDYSPELLFFDVGNSKAFYQVPVHLLYKESIDDLWENILQWEQTDTPNIVGSNLPIRVMNDQLHHLIDFAWIALLERPGTDGQLQMTLEGLDIPYNTSDIPVMNLLQNKERLKDFLKENDFKTQPFFQVDKEDYEAQVVSVLKGIEANLQYPMTAEQMEQYCRLSPRPIQDRKDLLAWLDLVFRDSYSISDKEKEKWKIETKPVEDSFLLRSTLADETNVFTSPFVVGVYTMEQEDATISYECSNLMTTSDGAFTALEIKIDNWNEIDLLSQLNKELERLVSVLDIRGFGMIEGLVRISPTGQAMAEIGKVWSIPVLGADSQFTALEWQNEQSMPFVVDKIITFGTQRAEKRKTSTVKNTIMESENVKENTGDVPVSDLVVATADAISEVKEVATKQPLLSFLKEFFKSKTFWINVGAILGFLFLSFIALKLWLSSYTDHGEFIVVDNFIGQDLEDGISKAASQDLEMVVLEKHFEAGATPNEIYQQSPKADAHIKLGRKIYVNIYSKNPMEVELPPLIGNDNYELYTRSLRKQPLQLKTVIKEKKFDAKIENNTILYLYYHGNKITPNDLKKGVKVLQGDTIKFVVTTRFSNYANVPDVVCQNFDAVEFILTSSDLKLGEVVGGTHGFVTKQEPAAGKRMKKGSKVKIFTAATRPERCKN